VKKISEQPIKVLVLTGCDEARTRSDAKFLDHQ
jgi:hypothetical protein